MSIRYLFEFFLFIKFIIPAISIEKLNNSELLNAICSILILPKQ